MAYFEYLCGEVCYGIYPSENLYHRLLDKLFSTRFIPIIAMDDNREAEGNELRWRYYGVEDNEACSVLEMMVSLSMRAENIMETPMNDNRTGLWFWSMINNLGLCKMTDDNYDDKVVNLVLHGLMERQYSPNGAGGLFYIPQCEQDLREVEIWYQMLWWLNDQLERN